MKLLLVSQYFWPESMRVNDVAAALTAAGATVEVLTGQPNYPDGRVFPGYAAWRPRREVHDGIEIERVPIIPRGRGGGIRLALNYLSFLVSGLTLAPWLVRGFRYDLVFFFAASPITSAIPALLLARLRRVPVVIWVQDLWPESLVVTGYVTNRRIIAAVAAIVRWIYRASDVVLVQSAAMVDDVRAVAGPISVIVHPNPGEVIGTDQATAAPSLAGEFVIVFAGNLGSFQALEVIVDAAALVADTPGIHFAFVGSGSRSRWLADTIAARGLTNCTMTGRLPATAMPAIFAQAGALLVSLLPNPAMDRTVPSKLQSYLAAGKPIIASLDGEGARVVDAAGAGAVARAGSAIELADAARRLHAMPAAERAMLGANGRAYFDAHYSSEILTPRLLAVFDDAIRQHKRR